MPARSIPRPSQEGLTSPEQIHQWLTYLCLNSTSRGIGGHEFREAVDSWGLGTKNLSSQAVADELRGHLRARYRPHGQRTLAGDAGLAKLQLLGLTPEAMVQPRAIRRQLASQAMGHVLNTFQRRYERALLRDVADDVWGLLAPIGKDA